MSKISPADAEQLYEAILHDFGRNDPTDLSELLIATARRLSPPEPTNAMT
ncbi:hypothetical protein LCGC14_2915990, partial [marine sediment metagenome]